jgi:hypothetical protein
VIPIFLAKRFKKAVNFPTLFSTIYSLRKRLPWIALLVIAGLSILVIHLALYPWPNLARDPARYAGLTRFQARGEAEQALPSGTLLKFSTLHREVLEGQDAWFVYFRAAHDGKYNGCYVVVIAHTSARAQPQCLN